MSRNEHQFTLFRWNGWSTGVNDFKQSVGDFLDDTKNQSKNLLVSVKTKLSQESGNPEELKNAACGFFQDAKEKMSSISGDLLGSVKAGLNQNDEFSEGDTTDPPGPHETVTDRISNTKDLLSEVAIHGMKKLTSKFSKFPYTQYSSIETLDIDWTGGDLSIRELK